MKSILLKILIATFISLFSIASAEAWHCHIHNAKGEGWKVWGPTRAKAAANATKYCVYHSHYASDCVIKNCKP